jgi:hypothetical protein
MSNVPGIGGKPFYIKFEKDWVKKGDILNNNYGYQIKVTKVYKYYWWKKILRRLGFKVRWFEAKVIKRYKID